MEELLGVEQSKRKAQADKYKALFKEYVEHGKIDECIEISRKAVREFPRDWELQNQLMYALFISGSDDGNIQNWQENIKKYRQEIVHIGENIIAHCTDDAIRLDAKSRLGFHYCELGELEKGRAIFESLPDIDACKESMLYWALRGEERKQHNREMFSLFFKRAVWSLWSVASDSDIELRERINIFLKFEKAVKLFYDKNDLGDWYYSLSQLYFIKLAPLALEMGDIDEMFGYMQRGVEYMKSFAEMPDKYVHTSETVKGVTDYRYADTADSRTPWSIIIERYLSDKIYDHVRNDERFKNILSDLNAIAYSN